MCSHQFGPRFWRRVPRLGIFLVARHVIATGRSWAWEPRHRQLCHRHSWRPLEDQKQRSTYNQQERHSTANLHGVSVSWNWMAEWHPRNKMPESEVQLMLWPEKEDPGWHCATDCQGRSADISLLSLCCWLNSYLAATCSWFSMLCLPVQELSQLALSCHSTPPISRQLSAQGPPSPWTNCCKP